MTDEMSQTQLVHVFDSFYLSFVIVSNTTGMAHLKINLLKPTGYVMHQQFNIQQLYSLPTLYLCVLYLSENKQRLVPLKLTGIYNRDEKCLQRGTDWVFNP